MLSNIERRRDRGNVLGLGFFAERTSDPRAMLEQIRLPQVRLVQPDQGKQAARVTEAMVEIIIHVMLVVLEGTFGSRPAEPARYDHEVQNGITPRRIGPVQHANDSPRRRVHD